MVTANATDFKMRSRHVHVWLYTANYGSNSTILLIVSDQVHNLRVRGSVLRYGLVTRTVHGLNPHIASDHISRAW